MGEFAGVVKDFFAHGGHRVVFCCNYKLSRLYQLYGTIKEKRNEADAVDADITKVI